ncbi:MAG TPA: beta-propeller fold lactonase family protein, partial [Candidatus Binataceae bacterium]|nr:beta-propeller fold lactonase family protein [Candidatus Binataceae bacterium]
NLSSGALTALSTSHITAGNDPQWIALTPAGNFAYASNFGTLGSPGTGSISLYTVGSTTEGELAPNSPSLITASIVNPAGLTVGTFESSPFLYVTDQGADDIVSYSINSTNGSLQATSSLSLGAEGLPGPVILDASGDFIYATDTALGGVYPFQQTASGLVLISPGFYPSANAGTNASVGLTSVITTSSNEYLFVANEASNSITEFQVANGVGTLTLVTTYTIGNLDDPTGVAAVTDSTSGNSYLYATNQGNGTVSIFSINPGNGALSFLTTVSTGASGNQPMFPLIAY